MGIYIKDMEIPYNCDVCPIGDCPHDAHFDSYKMMGGRPNDCPLIEAPPHGKWILYNKEFGFTHYCSNCNFAVKEQWIGFYNFCPSCGADMREAEGKGADI